MITFKWVVFWGIGMRLFTCGIKQIIQPQFTANTIFSVADKRAYPIIRELGFANLCFGLSGLLSIFFKEFRATAAFLGLLYYSLAFFQHMSNCNKNKTELFVTVTDFSIVIEILTCILLIL